MEDDCKEQQLVKVEVHDVEEGEISDSASVEEITEEAFKFKEAPVPSASAAPPSRSTVNLNNINVINNNTGGASGARVWTMRDVYKYQISSKTSYSGLYNLAWAQAVNNKPLGDVFVMMEDGSNDNGKGNNDTSGMPSSNINENKIVINVEDESEKEEGELEEGEIDLDSELVVENKDLNVENKNEVQRDVNESNELERIKRVDSIKKELENLNVVDSQGSYDSLCSSLATTADSLQKLILENSFAEKDSLIQLLLTAIQKLYSVFSSMTLQLKDQNKVVLSRLLAQVISLKPPLFSSLQFKGLEAIRSSVEQAGEGFNTSDSVVYSKPAGFVNCRHKGGPSLPLLDLHKDHDADSLPSPTRDLSAPLPFDKGFIMVKPEWPLPRTSSLDRGENAVMHPYETDAVKAVSSYQQKFGGGSFFMDDKFPSPTPSEEGHGHTSGDGETSEEVSSSIKNKVNPAVQPVVSVSSTPEITNPRIVSSASSSRKSSAKSRDPRLRLANPDASDESKSELVFDGPALKRRRNENTMLPLATATSTSTSPVTTPASLPVSTPPITSPILSQTEKLPVKNSNAAASLHSLLRDIAVNPSIWMDILKMENQKTSDDIKSMTQLPNSNSILGAVPSTTGALPFSSTPSGLAQTPSQVTSVEESGKARMKPRDPRRILHNSALQKGVTANSGSDQHKPSASSGLAMISSSSNASRHEDQLEKKSVSSNGSKPPDITMQFTNNLRNIADILSVSQASMPPSSSQQVLKETKGVVTEPGNPRNGSDLTSEAIIAVPPRPLNANAWSDVEHLFDGFDEQQKAAIQKERARRLDEQKKMFAVRKLCLVLDLDHTLLNSAKFVEVDPVHDEMLRKKEEQDREKAHRHLFRFPHMGMWTKLRPGIWNFLEKASKLYELHLYTMGNKYYATEMAKLLDPKGELFSGRVISRGDDGEAFDSDDRVPKSKDLEGVLGMESAVVIIDDSIRVWPHNKLNLIVVERYIYFPCSRRQFGLPGPSLLEIDHDERPEEGTLASSLAVIERIHNNFFAHESLDEADVRNILACEQRKILGGCRIVFSRVFPVGEAKPHMHPLWQAAEQFGAVCVNQIDEQVTHVVANSLGTDKVNWAISTGRFVVHPGWVEASTLLYRRANEHDFAIKQQ